jgi:DnaD/phage-associated family protein
MIPEPFQTNTIQDKTIQDKSKDKEEGEIKNDSGCFPPIDEALQRVAMEFQSSGYGTINSTVSDVLISLTTDYSPEWVVMALKEGVTQGKRKLSYVKGILKNWKADGGPKTGNSGQAKSRGMPQNVQSALDLVEKYKLEEGEVQ